MKRLLVSVAILIVCTAFSTEASQNGVSNGLTIQARCAAARCETTENVLSVPLGTEIEFQAVDQTGIETVRWDMGDGTAIFQLAFRYKFDSPGKYMVSVTAYYVDGSRAKSSLTVHVISAPGIVTGTSLMDKALYAVIGVVLTYLSAVITSLLGV